jgi:hypothetical protein
MLNTLPVQFFKNKKTILNAVFLYEQPDALIIQIYSVIKLYMFQASSLPIIRSFPLYIGTGKFHAGFDNRFQAESVWTMIGSGHQNLHKIYQCQM